LADKKMELGLSFEIVKI